MTNETQPDSRFDRITNEIVSGGTQRAVDAAPTPTAMLLGIAAWVGLLGSLLWFRPWMFVFVVGVAVSIMLHEFGHFYTARKSGMKATQFFLGFGPRVWSTHRNGVEYGLRAIPLGGFVKIIGMSSMDEVDPDDEPYTYRQASFPKRMWVITAGSVMHIFIALVTIVAVYGFAGRVEEAGRVTVYSVSADSPAAKAGVAPNDIITAVGGTTVTTSEEFHKALASSAPGTTVDLALVRGGSPLHLSATLIQSPYAPAGQTVGFLGVSNDSKERIQQSWFQAVTKGPRDLVSGVGQATVGIAKVLNPVNVMGHLTGSNTDPTSRPTTLVGAAKMSSDYGKYDGWAGILSLLAALNVSVGVFNMFPLLPLDGGHAAIAIYERSRERKGKRYFADISKLMPVVTVTLALLAFMFFTGVYLDTVKG
jgi:membrane-associated protease RseP (regulator of RpoE activity)